MVYFYKYSDYENETFREVHNKKVFSVIIFLFLTPYEELIYC